MTLWFCQDVTFLCVHSVSAFLPFLSTFNRAALVAHGSPTIRRAYGTRPDTSDLKATQALQRLAAAQCAGPSCRFLLYAAVHTASPPPRSDSQCSHVVLFLTCHFTSVPSSPSNFFTLISPSDGANPVISCKISLTAWLASTPFMLTTC